MTPESLPHLSPEHELAHKIAAQEQTKYCQEFWRWRKSRGGQCSLGEISAPAEYADLASRKEGRPFLPMPHPSA
jgi:GH24 family phage-related lysozyme (muramidase)